MSLASFQAPVFPEPRARLEDGPYMAFTRSQWAALRKTTPMTLNRAEVRMLKGINDALSLQEVAEIYLPLARLLNLYVDANQQRGVTLDRFLGRRGQHPPFVIGIAGSVAVGKSTTARVLQALLRRWPTRRNVALVATDGFLYPNAVLEARGLMDKKGFPISFDINRLIEFMADIKAGHTQLEVPVYSHLVYDVLGEQTQFVDQPDILILEGLNVLQSDTDYPQSRHRVFVSDFIDFSIYVDASIAQLNHWFIHRFMKLRDRVFSNPDSYFHKYAELSDSEATAVADGIWQAINEVNLRQNILPTRERASLILSKGPRHAVDCVRLRK
ncbi:MAG TPA: type I pantothenate kinase [Salinisphaeraceae bacterium]|nr:type I pantothenate kinase [Salinisphaeraceae bacterium]